MIPMMIPRGEAIAKMKTSHLQRLKLFGNVLTRAIPRELAAAPLWIAIAMAIVSVYLISGFKPKASPSNRACVDRAIIKTKGVMFGQHEPALRASTSIYASNSALVLLAPEGEASVAKSKTD